MLRSAARSKGTWVAMLAALVLGFALFVLLSSPGLHTQPAQAQTAAPRASLTIDGKEFASFSNVDEATSSIKLPRSDGTIAQLAPIRIVLERPATTELTLSSWHEQARTQLTGYRKNCYLTFYDGSGKPTMKLSLKNAWPAEYHLEQQGTQMVERVTLTATSFVRVAP